MQFYAEEGGTPTPYMGTHCHHLANTISHLNYLLRRRCGLMSNYFDHFPAKTQALAECWTNVMVSIGHWLQSDNGPMLK